MYHTSSVVTAITADRIREAEDARRAGRMNKTESAQPKRSRRLRSLALRVASPGLR